VDRLLSILDSEGLLCFHRLPGGGPPFAGRGCEGDRL